MNARSALQTLSHRFGIMSAQGACLAWVIATIGYASLSWGQILSDPTRPPQEWLAAQTQSAGNAVPETTEVPAHLQSLLIGRTRKYAIIDGELLSVGDTFKDNRVMAVRPDGVELRSPRGTQTLKLFSDVVKQPVKPVAADTVGTRPGEKRRVSIGVGNNSVVTEKK